MVALVVKEGCRLFIMAIRTYLDCKSAHVFKLAQGQCSTARSIRTCFFAKFLSVSCLSKQECWVNMFLKGISACVRLLEISFQRAEPTDEAGWEQFVTTDTRGTYWECIPTAEITRGSFKLRQYRMLEVNRYWYPFSFGRRPMSEQLSPGVAFYKTTNFTLGLGSQLCLLFVYLLLL